MHGESYVNGMMMTTDDVMSIAIRKRDGSIGESVEKRTSLVKKYRIFNFIILRGIARFLEGSVIQFYAEKRMKKIERGKKISGHSYQKGKKTKDISSARVLVSVTLSAGIFIYFILPTIIAYFAKTIVNSDIVLNILEGMIRLFIFVILFYLFSYFERANGTVLYHGAEHKILWCHKHNEELTLENVRKYPIWHPSCGTGVFFFMICISIPLFLFLNYENLLNRSILMLVLLPIIIGIAFELTIWLDDSQSKLAKILSMPVLLLQRLNTKEPDDAHLEVALTALKNLLDYKHVKN